MLDYFKLPGALGAAIVVVALTAPAATAQDALEGTALHSPVYTIVSAEQKIDSVGVDLGALAAEAREYGDFDTLMDVDAMAPERADVDSLLTQHHAEIYRSAAGSDIPELRAIAEGAARGGLSALAADEMMSIFLLHYHCVANNGTVPPGSTRLVLSIMDLHYNMMEPLDTSTRSGQFDVTSFKTVSCIVDGEMKQDLLRRRWVINVNGALETKENSTGPNGVSYGYHLFARGLTIQLVSLYYGNTLIAANDPDKGHFYDNKPENCIDVFFAQKPAMDDRIESWLGNLLFCAGGDCKDKNPHLDATM